MTDSPTGGPFDDLLGRLTDAWDPWTSMPAPIPYPMFGKGSRHPFPWYFDGISRVSVSSLLDIEEWLRDCHYLSDETLFGQDDYWQHPGEFEQIRMGDCDDHALWAWRKVVELGHSTSFVIGKWRDEPDGLHTWLVATVSGEQHVFEATSKVRGDALRPLRDVRDAYRPYLSVDDRFRTRAYLGSVQDLFYLPASKTPRRSDSTAPRHRGDR